MNTIFHEPIMTQEILSFLPEIDNPVFVDGTTGEGGHSELFLKNMKSGTLISIDRDPVILNIARDRLKKYTYINHILVNDNFSNINEILSENNISGIDFIFLDLGISMFHFKGAERGFSFNDDALDMRLDENSEQSAYDIVNYFDEKEIADILKIYGEESFAKRIARTIVEKRKEQLIEKAVDLKNIIVSAIPKKFQKDKINPATQSFQALRIYVNDELSHLKKTLYHAMEALNLNGRIAVFSFHSLEDRIVKNIFRHFAKSCNCPDNYPMCQCDGKAVLKLLSKKPIIPTMEECQANPASRSTKLRIVEKINEVSESTWELYKRTSPVQ